MHIDRKAFALCLAGILAIGVALGGYFFIGSQPRAFPRSVSCGPSCSSLAELAGLAGSVGMHLTPGLLPDKVAETQRCVAINNPLPDEEPLDIVVIPKKDIKDIADVSVDDMPYVVDCIGLMRAIIQERHLATYRVLTNGPGFQKVRYLHFHILTGPAHSGKKHGLM